MIKIIKNTFNNKILLILLILVILFIIININFKGCETKNIIKNINENFNNIINIGETTRDNSINNNSNKKTITLLYKLACPHSQLFMTTWQLLKDSITSDIEMIEIDCDKNSDICSRFNIKGVPALIITNGDKFKTLTGNLSFVDIVSELKLIGISIASIEGYINYISGHTVEGDERKTDDPDCPFVSFRKADRNTYCINSKSIYGCSTADEGSVVNEFDTAFSMIGGYLNGLPDKSNINKCALKHKNSIKTFELCDSNLLKNKKNYKNLIEDKKAINRFLKVDYNDNVPIVDAIMNACVN